MRSATILAVFVPTLAFADHFREAVEGAAEAMDQSYALARRGGPPCRQAMKAPIDRAIDDVDDLLSERGAARVGPVREQVSALAAAAGRAGCPEGVGRKLFRAVERLDDARAALGRPGPGDGRVSRGSTPVELAQLRITPATVHDTENVAQVDVPEVRFHRQRGLRFRLGARVRAQNGQFGEWQVDQMYQVPDDEFFWGNAWTFYVRHSLLRGIDTAGGRFVVRVTVLGENNEELGAVDQPLEINFRGPMAPAPAPLAAGKTGPHVRPALVVVRPGAVAPPPPPGVAQLRPAQRDCGTGADPGCDTTRNGLFAMDAGTFHGLMTSLRNTPSEFTREQMVDAVLATKGITAIQLGHVLDLFRSELTKLNVARKAAPRCTNPGDAIGLSVKFRSSLNQAEYVKLMSSQR